MQRCDDRRPFSHHRVDALDRARMDVADGKDAGRARLLSSAPSARVATNPYSVGSDEKQQVPDTSLPNMFGRQRIIFSRAPVIVPFNQYARNASIGSGRSQPSSRSCTNGSRISGSGHHFPIIADPAPLENPIGFDKPRAILKVPKTGIQ
jgi:hypothetical protein